jgi:protein-tyrosine-phosphatase
MNMLILSPKNAARSLMLESIFNTLGKGRISAYSAAPHPAANIHPAARAVLAQKSHATQTLHCKHLDIFLEPEAPVMVAVITVGNTAFRRPWPGTPLTAHWGVEDPASIHHPAAFEIAYAMLEARAKAWLSLDFERMERAEQQHHLSRIGESSLVM